MQIFLIVLTVILLTAVLFIVTNLKFYIEFDNVSAKNFFKLKVYIFSFLPVFVMKKEIKGEDKGISLKKKFEEIIEYFVKSKADPVIYAKKKAEKSDDVPEIFRKFDFSKLYLENMTISLCLDLNNAAVSAISTGIINAIIGIAVEKYRDNIKGPVKYKVFPGYSGNGIKVVASTKLRIKMFYILKSLLLVIKRRSKLKSSGKGGKVIKKGGI